MQYIKENESIIENYNNLINEINFEIILESMQSSFLKKLIQQSKKASEEYHDKKALNLYYVAEPVQIQMVINNLPYKWDKITDDRFVKYDNTDANGLKLAKRLCSNRSNSIQGMILFPNSDENDKENMFTGFIVKDMYQRISYYNIVSKRESNEYMKPTKAIEYVKSAPYYYLLELTQDDQTYDLRNSRVQSRVGMVHQGDESWYKELAKENMARYKKLAAKMKLEKLKDDLPDKVITCVNTVMELAKEFGDNPEKYHTFEYDIKSLLELVSDKSYMSTDGRRGKYFKHGIDGLMYYFTLYLQYKLNVGTGKAQEYEIKGFETQKANLKAMLDKINNKYLELKRKIQAAEAKQES